MEFSFRQLQDYNLPKIRQNLPRIRVKSDIPQIILDDVDFLFNFDESL